MHLPSIHLGRSLQSLIPRGRTKPVPWIFPPEFAARAEKWARPSRHASAINLAVAQLARQPDGQTAAAYSPCNHTAGGVGKADLFFFNQGSQAGRGQWKRVAIEPHRCIELVRALNLVLIS
jgi:hypothetical protein